MTHGIISLMRFKSFYNYILFGIFFISFSFMQVFPLIQIILACILFFFVFFNSSRHLYFNITDISLFLYLCFLFLSFYSFFISIFNINTPEYVLYDYFKVLIVYPTFGYFLSLSIKYFLNYRTLILIVLSSYFFITFVNLFSLVIFLTDYFSFFDIYLGSIGILPSFYDGRFILSSLNIPVILYLLPLFIFFLFKLKINNFFKYISLFLVFLIIFFSGRRAIWLISFLFLFYFFYSYFFFNKNIFVKLFILIFFILIIFHFYDFIINTFRLSSEFSSSIRLNQHFTFIFTFFDNPFGLGFGSSFYDFRSDSYVSIFELTFHKLLVDSGFIFIFIFIFIFFVFRFKFLQLPISLRSSGVPIIVSLIFVFLLNFSNPYLLNFDGIIFLFFLTGYFDKLQNIPRGIVYEGSYTCGWVGYKNFRRNSFTS